MTGGERGAGSACVPGVLPPRRCAARCESKLEVSKEGVVVPMGGRVRL